MTDSEKKLAQALDALELPAGACTEEELERTLAGVLRKTRRRPRRAALLAAAALAAVLLAAAAFYSVSDAFRGIPIDESGKQIPAASGAIPALEKSGTLFDGATVSKNGLTLSAQAIFGGDGRYYMLLDVTRDDGPLSVIQADGTPSAAPPAFRETIFSHGEAFSAFEWANTAALGPPSGNRARMLVNILTGAEPLKHADNLSFRFTDLQQEAVMPGEALTLETALDQLPSKFQVHGSYFTTYNSWDTGEERRALIFDGKQEVPLNSRYGVAVTMAAFQNGSLYLRGRADQGSLWRQAAALRSRTTGRLIPAAWDYYDLDTGSKWNLRFDGLSSQEALKDMDLLVNAGKCDSPLINGVWEITVPFQVTDITRVIEWQKPFSAGGYPFVGDSLKISIFDLTFNFHAATAQAAMAAERYQSPEFYAQEVYAMTPLPDAQPWEEYPAAFLTMKDGSTVELGGYVSWGDSPQAFSASCSAERNWSAQFFLKDQTVIDPQQAVSFTFGEVTVPIS